MHARQANAIPDKWQQRVRQPVHPTQVFDFHVIVQFQVQPNIEEFINTNSGNKIWFEPGGQQETFD